MGRHIMQRSGSTILFACVWAALILCAFFLPTARPVAKAHAASMNDVLEIKVLNATGEYIGDTTPSDWGNFYRGMKLLEKASFVSKNGESATAYIYTVNEEENIVTLNEGTPDPDLENTYGKIEYNGTMFSNNHAHDFTTGAGNGDWAVCEDDDTNLTHWAVCDCGAKFQVAHRPVLSLDGTYKCLDCDADLPSNEYTFTIPESFSEDGVDGWDNGTTAVISIDFSDVYIYVGYTLTLNLQCSGRLIFDDTSSISYTITVETDKYGEVAEGELEFDGTEPVPIWWLTPTEENEYITFGSDLRTDALRGTITITLELNFDSSDESFLYSGTYSDVLTFSATLELVEA